METGETKASVDTNAGHRHSRE